MARQHLNGIRKQELEAALAKLKELPKELQAKKRKAILKKSAKPMLAAAKAKAPVGQHPHARYNTVKLIEKKAPKGSGNIAAVYNPGNLRASLQFLALRKARSAVHIGPKLSKSRQGAGEFGPGQRVDGYYAHFVEFGAGGRTAKPYMRPAFDSTKSVVIANVTKEVQRVVNSFAKKNKV